MRLASELPTIETLQEKYPINDIIRARVALARLSITRAFDTGEQPIIIAGPCSMTAGVNRHLAENRALSSLAEEADAVIIHRDNPWKPRSNADELYWGHETTDSEEAFHITMAIAQQNGNLAMEFGHTSHIDRYSQQTAFAWRGSRNDADKSLLNEMAHINSLPIGIKNGMDGTINSALEDVRVANSIRQGVPGAAPAMLIFRGGSELQTPATWMEAYKRAHDATEGRFVLDVAHGSEMAFDPSGKFGKSALGQRAVLAEVLDSGILPHAYMIETSDIPSLTDPVVPLDQSRQDIERIALEHARRAASLHNLSAD